jgi:hypothetical protein
MIERRNEIVLYVLPRGLEITILTMIKHRYLFRVPQFEAILFSVIIAVLHYYY